MLKSPEAYLSELSFEPPESQSRSLSSGEKIFIEKYLGLEAFERLPEVVPEDGQVLLMPEQPEAGLPDALDTREQEPEAAEPAPLDAAPEEATAIEAREKALEAPPLIDEMEAPAPETGEPAGKTPEVITSRVSGEAFSENAPQDMQRAELPTIEAADVATFLPETALQAPPDEASRQFVAVKEPGQFPEISVETARKEAPETEKTGGDQGSGIEPAEPETAVLPESRNAEPALQESPVTGNAAAESERPADSVESVSVNESITESGAPVSTCAVEAVKTAAVSVKSAEQEKEAEKSLREKLKNEPEIQMVSFFTAGQLFLLPVMSIQEVLRHQELIKVPQAPEFVAGVINLRGHVMPIVHLSALLTNASEHPYSGKNFIIVCGTEQLKIGLVIDRINSMHLLPQSKIIWNAESKLGDSAEFLCAIANMDEKVCGIVEPESIAQKILSP